MNNQDHEVYYVFAIRYKRFSTLRRFSKGIVLCNDVAVEGTGSRSETCLTSLR